MAVPENATAQGKDGGPRTTRTAAIGRGWRGALRCLSFYTLLSLGAAAFAADIIPLANGDAGKRPSLDSAPNGVTVVQIAAPSAAGVSHNQYQQFNVGASGAILNNSQQITQTRLGGYINGNANLAQGSARVILNEVVARNPSQLQGYLEVAGQKADVIIANPWGISCSGCGFINTRQATLTTGTPVVDGGSLTGYQVNDGTVSVSGAGLDARGADSFSIIARALQLNAGLYATTLTAVLGRNQVDAATLAATPLAGAGATSPAPTLALDVSQLGGMYAGAIKLIGTEAGVGVNSRGQIQATQGSLQLSSAGDLTLGGQTAAQGDLSLHAAGNLQHQGVTAATGSIDVTSGHTAQMDGTLAAQGRLALSADSIAGAGTLVAGGQTDGTLGATGTLQIDARQELAHHGQLLAAGDITLSGARIDAADSHIVSGSGGMTLNSAGDLLADRATLNAAGALNANAGGRLSTAHGTMNADQLTLNAGDIDNSNGTLNQSGAGQTTISAQSGFSNHLGTLSTQGRSVRLGAATLDNSGGTISLTAAGEASVLAATLDNSQQGRLNSNGALTLQLNRLDNRSGSLTSLDTLNVRAADSLDNGQGTLASRQTVNLSAGTVSNRQGLIQASGLALDVDSLDNTQGSLLDLGSQGRTTVSSRHDIGNQHGVIASNTALTVTANAFDNSSQGKVSSLGELAATLASLGNQSGTFSSAGTLTLATSGALDNSQGLLGSQQALTLVAGTLSNRQGLIQASGLALDVDSLDNTQGSLLDLSHQGNTTVSSRHDIGNQHGVIASNTALTVTANALDNSSQGQVDSQSTLTATLASLGNQGGAFSSVGALTIATSGALDNSQGLLGSQQTLTLTGGGLSNRQGLIQASGLALDVDSLDNTQGSLLDLGSQGSTTVSSRHDIGNQHGVIASNTALTVTANAFDNSSQGQVGSQSTLTATLASLGNQGGVFSSVGALTIATSGTLDNSQGLLGSQQALTLASAALANQQGRIQAGGALTLNADSLDNRAGHVTALGQHDASRLDIRQAIDNRGGSIGGNADLTLAAKRLDNSAGGTLSSDAGLNLTLAADLDNRHGTVAARALTLQLDTLANQAGDIEQINNVPADANAPVPTGVMALTARTLDSTQGRIVAQGDLSLSARQVTNIDTLQAGHDLSLHSDAGISAGSGTQWTAGHDLTVSSPAAIVNAGQMLAGHTLTLEGASLSNSGTLQGDEQLTATLTQSLDNSASGVFSGRLLSLNAPAIGNRGLIAGLTVTLQGDTLLNDGAQANLVASADMSLQLGTRLVNSNGAWINADGNLLIGRADRPTQEVRNTVATIEAGGNATVYAGTVSNESNPVTVTQTTTSSSKTLTTMSLPSACSYGEAPGTGHNSGGGGRWTCSSSFNFVGNLDFANGSSQTYGNVTYTLLNDDTANKAITVRVQTEGAPTSQTQQYYYFSRSGSSYFYLPGFDPNTTMLSAFNSTTATVWNPQQIAAYNAQIASDPSATFSPGGSHISVSIDGALVSGRDTLAQDREKSRTTTTQVTTDHASGTANGAKWWVGGDLNFNAQTVVNRYSAIAAQGNITVVGTQQIQNIGQSLNQTTVSTIGNNYWDHSESHTQSSTVQIGSLDATVSAGKALTLSAPTLANTTINPATAATVATTVATTQASADGSAPQAVRSGYAVPTVGASAAAGSGTSAAQAGIVLQAGSARAANPVASNYSLPSGGLFTTPATPGLHYLVETDPRFTQYQPFISSDYLLSRIGYDPNTTEKRLGDGYYEQHLISQSVSSLTGQRFLAGYQSASEQYQGLMDNGVRAAQQLQLTPGIALSAEQMSKLTQDMVWLVTQHIGGQDVLVPVVYLAGQSSVTGKGAVLAATTMNLHADGTLSNSGQLSTQGGSLQVQAQDIAMQGGQVSSDGAVTLLASHDVQLNSAADQQARSTSVSGASVDVQAGHDLRLSAASVTASGDARLLAGNDLTLGYTQARQQNTVADGTWSQSSTHTQGSTVSSGGTLTLAAGHDLNVAASSAQAGTDLSATAGNAVTLAATVDSSQEQMNSRLDSGFDHRNDSVNAAQLKAQGQLAVGAGQDLTVSGSTLQAGTGATLQAGRDVKLDTVATTSSNGDYSRGGNINHVTDVNQNGSTISAGNGLSVSAGQDIQTRDALLTTTQGQLALNAGRDIAIGAIDSTHSEYHKTERDEDGLFNSTHIIDIKQFDSQSANGSELSGDSFALHSGRDLAITGSSVAATGNGQLQAGRNIDIQAATNASQQYSYHDSSTSGMFSGGGIGVTFGHSEQTSTLHADGTTQSQSRSLVGSTAGTLDIEAGGHAAILGSDVTAARDVNVKAQALTIDPGRDTYHSVQVQTAKSGGLTVQLTSPVISAVQTVYQMAEAVKKPHDDRTVALAAGTAALAGYNSYLAFQQALAGQGDNKDNGIRLSITIGGSQSESRYENTSTGLAGSLLKAGGNLNLAASGAGQDSNIDATAAQLLAGQNASLSADNAIRLQSGQNTSTQTSRDTSRSGGVGVAIAYSEKGGFAFGFTANYSQSRGHSDGDDVTQVGTTLNAGQTLTLNSGGDTTLKGASASAQTIQAKVGGNLDIQSRQDTSTFGSHSESLSAQVTAGIGFSASGSYNLQQMHNDYASVLTQSGLKAGDGGFQVQVGGNTNLTGAVIASSQGAIDAGRNSLSTASLTSSSIDNHANYSALSLGLSGGGSASGSGGSGGNSHVMSFSNGGGANAPGIAYASDNQSSTTTSGISAGALTVTGSQPTPAIDRTLTTATDTTHALGNHFDQAKLQNALDVTQAAEGQIGTFAATKAADAEAAKKKLDNAKLSGTADEIAAAQTASDEAAKWAPGGRYRQILNAISAGISGNVAGGIDDAISKGVVNYFQQQGASYIGNLVTQGIVSEGSPAHAALHAIVACAGSAAASQSCSAGAMGAASSSLLTNLFSDDKALTAADKEARKNLLVSLVAGVASATTQEGLVTATNAATAAADNNWLMHSEQLRLNSLDKQCKAHDAAACDSAKQLRLKDLSRNLQLLTACSGKNASLCTAELSKARAAANSYPASDVYLGNGSASGMDNKKLMAELKSINDVIDIASGRNERGKQAALQIASQILDFIPLIGTLKQAYEVKTLGDALLAIASVVPEAGPTVAKLSKEAQALADAGKLDEAQNLLKAGVQTIDRNWQAATKELGSSTARKGVTTGANSAGSAGVTVVDQAATGIQWGKGIKGQGLPYEDYVASTLPPETRLPANFRTFDFFDIETGVATSVKTLDTTTAAKVANPSQVYSSLKGNVDTAANFKVAALSGTVLKAAQINARELNVAIPANTTSAQWTEINKAIQYGQSKGVTVKITVIK